MAHIQEQHRPSLLRYGRPRITDELQELGLEAGHRRVGRPLRQICFVNRRPGNGCTRMASRSSDTMPGGTGLHVR